MGAEAFSRRGGGISVAEGARTYIESVSFTNVFSEKVSENDELYVRTLTNKSLRDPSDATFAWSYSGTPFAQGLQDVRCGAKTQYCPP